MGILSNQFANVVEWEEYDDSLIFWKWANREIKKGSRHYAKRQVTWFKRYPFANMCDINDKENIMKLIDDFIRK